MSLYRKAVGLTACALLLASGCDKTEPVPVLPKMDEVPQQQAPQTDARNGNIAQTERDEFLRKSREEIEQLRSRVDALEAKAKGSGAELKARMEKQIADWREQLKTVETQWQKVKDASAAAWQETKTALTAAIDKLRQAIDREAS